MELILFLKQLRTNVMLKKPLHLPEFKRIKYLMS